MESLYDKYEQGRRRPAELLYQRIPGCIPGERFFIEIGGGGNVESLAEMRKRTVSELLDELYPKFLDMGYSPSFSGNAVLLR